MRQRRVWLLAAAAALVAGCSAAGSAETPAPTVSPESPTPQTMSASPSASEPDPQAQAKADVLAVYATFMDARNKSLNNPRKPPDRRLFQVSIPPARDGAYNAVLYYRRQGIKVRGAPVSNPSVGKITGEFAKISDCLDSNPSLPVFVNTGESALAPGQGRRIVIDVDAKRVDGAWQISRWVPDRSHKC
jgi:hypothetical protein